MTALKLLFLVLLIPLLPDLFGNPNFFESHFKYPSELFLLISVVIFILARTIIDFRFDGMEKKLIFFGFMVFSILSVSLSAINFLNHPNFVYSITRINFPEVFLISLALGIFYFGSFSNEFYKKKDSWFIFLFPILINTIGLVMWTWPFDRMYLLTREDTVVEYLQFSILVFASFYFIRSGLKLFYKEQKIMAVVYSLGSLIILFVALEEISWGQRIFSLNTPQRIEAINYQKELNIHNINYIAGYVTISYLVIGFWGSFLSFFVKATNLFKKSFLFFPSSLLFLYFLFPFFHSLYVLTHDNHNLGGFSELNELVLYLGIALFSFFAFNHLKSSNR